MQETFDLKIDNSRMMDSIENAYLKVTSPTGKSIFIKKLRVSNLASDAYRKTFYKFCGNPMKRFVGTKPATKNEMQILLTLSKL